MCANLDDVLADAAADELVALAVDRIDVDDTPGGDRGVPDTQSGAVHVVLCGELRVPGAALGHDPDILHSAAFERAEEVCFAFESECGDVHAVVANIERPASYEPSVDVVGFGDFRRAVFGRQVWSAAVAGSSAVSMKV
jgi:hypothetical protein